MGFISDLLTNISAFRIKIGEKLNWLNANKADTTALADYVKKDGSVAMTDSLKMKPQGTYTNNIHRDFRGVGNANYVRGLLNVLADNNQLQIATYVSNQTVENFFIANADLSGTGIEFNKDGTISANAATANNHAVNLGQVNGLVSNGNTAYNERVTQFNTTYTTSVYTFSILLANGVQKQTTLQVNNTHFTISGSGVLQLNAAIAQKIADSVTAADVASMGYQTASQVSTTVTNQISAFGFAPEGFEFFHGAVTIDTDEYREVIANYSGSGVVNIDVINPQYNGIVLTVQAGDNQLNLNIECLKGNSMDTVDEIPPGTANTYVFSDSLGLWVRRSKKMEF